MCPSVTDVILISINWGEVFKILRILLATEAFGNGERMINLAPQQVLMWYFHGIGMWKQRRG